MGAWIELKPEGAGPIRAWRADPAGPPRGGIVVIQEIFGVNSHIRDVTDRFAAEGYLAVAPAIFEHVEPRFETGYDPESRARGMAIAGKIDLEQVLRDVAAAIEVAKPRRQGRDRRLLPRRHGRLVGGGAPHGLERRGRLLRRRDHRAQGPEAPRPDAPAFRREGPAYPDRRRERGRRRPSGGRGPHLSRRSRLQLRPSARATTRRAPRSPGRARSRSCASIWGERRLRCRSLPAPPQRFSCHPRDSLVIPACERVKELALSLGL